MSICSQINSKLGLLLGFSGLECILFDLKSEMELLRVDTKGGARPLVFSENFVAWAQADQLSAQVFRKNYLIVKEPIHGREILSVTSIDGVIFTGSEDTTVKVIRDGIVQQTYSSQEASVKCLATRKAVENVLVLSAGSKMQAHLHLFKAGKLIPLS